MSPGAAAAIGGSLIEIRPGRVLSVAARPGIGRAETTIFFCHGGGGNKEHWRFLWAACVAAGHGVVAWDALGHGTSPRTRSRADYAGGPMLADYAAMVARYRTARTILVGHSFGARQTLVYLDELARQGRLGEVERAVLVASAPVELHDGGGGVAWLFKTLPLPVLSLLRPVLSRGFRKRGWHPDTDPALVAGEERVASGNSMFVLRAMLTQPAALSMARLSALDLPVLVLGGDRDGIVPQAVTEAIAAGLPRATLRIVTGAAHQIMMERPEETGRAMLEFIDGR